MKMFPFYSPIPYSVSYWYFLLPTECLAFAYSRKVRNLPNYSWLLLLTYMILRRRTELIILTKSFLNLLKPTRSCQHNSFLYFFVTIRVIFDPPIQIFKTIYHFQGFSIDTKFSVYQREAKIMLLYCSRLSRSHFLFFVSRGYCGHGFASGEKNSHRVISQLATSFTYVKNLGRLSTSSVIS